MAKQNWRTMDKSHTPLEQLRREFGLFNRTTNKSPRTVAWYDDKLLSLQRFLSDEATLADFTVANARAFIAGMQARTTLYPNTSRIARDGSLSSAYIQGFARSFRAFSSWLYAEEYNTTNVLKTMKPPKIQQK